MLSSPPPHTLSLPHTHTTHTQHNTTHNTTHLGEAVSVQDELAVLLAQVLGDLALGVHGRQVGGVGDVGAEAQLARALLGDDLVVAFCGEGAFGGGGGWVNNKGLEGSNGPAVLARCG